MSLKKFLKLQQESAAGVDPGVVRVIRSNPLKEMKNSLNACCFWIFPTRTFVGNHRYKYYI